MYIYRYYHTSIICLYSDNLHARILFVYLVGWFEASVADLRHRELLMVGLLGADDRGVGHQREVDAGVRHQVRLELRQVDVQGAVKPRKTEIQ